LVWTINYAASVDKQLCKLDRQIAKRIVAFMDDRIAPLDDPRSTGKALAGAVFGSYWRYRVGDYRVICDIQDGELCILVVELGNRKQVYQ
jgi:mRNA interferase RelE/StbE